jgi:hypothetical protein
MYIGTINKVRAAATPRPRNHARRPLIRLDHKSTRTISTFPFIADRIKAAPVARSPKESPMPGRAPKTASARAGCQIHPAEARSTKDAPNGPVTMMALSLLDCNHNCNFNYNRICNHNRSFILLSNPRTTSSWPITRDLGDHPPGIPCVRDGENSILPPTTTKNHHA